MYDRPISAITTTSAEEIPLKNVYFYLYYRKVKDQNQRIILYIYSISRPSTAKSETNNIKIESPSKNEKLEQELKKYQKLYQEQVIFIYFR